MISLLYHASAPDTFNKAEHLNLHYVDAATLMQQVQSLRRKFEFLSADEFIQAIRTKTPARVACLTFDDGYRDCWNSVVPQLDALSIPVEFYVNSSFVAGEPFWRDQIRAIISNGLQDDFIRFAGWQVPAAKLYSVSKDPLVFNSYEVRETVRTYAKTKAIEGKMPAFCSLEDLRKVEKMKHVKIGNHTEHHLVLASLTALQQQDEIESCQKFLQENFSSTKISRVFSIPFGNSGTYNEVTIQILKQLNFVGAFTTDGGAYLTNGPLTEVVKDFYLVKRFLPKQYWRPF